MQAQQKAARLKLMGFDVDGVLTDGRLWFGPEGELFKSFDSQDGHGIKLLQQAGVRVVIITGRVSKAVEHRAANLGITLLAQGIEDKVEAMTGFARELGVSLDECGYMGDDTVDLPVLNTCGFSATVATCHPAVRNQVDLVADRPGGRGAVREVCDFILHAKQTHS